MSRRLVLNLFSGHDSITDQHVETAVNALNEAYDTSRLTDKRNKLKQILSENPVLRAFLAIPVHHNLDLSLGSAQFCGELGTDKQGRGGNKYVGTAKIVSDFITAIAKLNALNQGDAALAEHKALAFPNHEAAVSELHRILEGCDPSTDLESYLCGLIWRDLGLKLTYSGVKMISTEEDLYDKD